MTRPKAHSLIGKNLIGKNQPSASVRRVGSYEAKTHLPRLLAEVESGKQIEITRNGRPIALISALAPEPAVPVREVIEQMKSARLGVRLEGLNILDLKKDGRR